MSNGGDPGEWAALRAVQLRAGAQFATLLAAVNILGVVAAMLFFRATAALPFVVAWGATAMAVAIGVTFRRLSARNRARVTATTGEVRTSAIDGLMLGIGWAAALIWFWPTAQPAASIGLWIVLTIVMTSTAIAMATLPLATLLFLGITGSAAAAALFMSAGPAPAAAAALFALLLAISCVGRGHALVLAHMQQLALVERDEIVSLLLNESHENAADWLWETDVQRRIVRANHRFALAIGADSKAIDGRPLLQALAGVRWEHDKLAPGFHTLAEKLKSREAFRNLRLPVVVDGVERWIEIAANPRYDGQGTFLGFRGVGSDITEALESTDKINRMARYDALTGLPNRLCVNEALATAIEDADKWGSRCAFMMIDLDRFKAINDSLGHPVGDRLLGRVADRLRQLMTDNEIIGRLGGDEFAVVVRDARAIEPVEELARTIIATLSRPYEVDQHTLYIGASVGLAIGPRDGRTAEMLIRSADLALYRSKDAGGGVFHCYEPELHVQAEERRVLEIALRGALQNDQFHLDFQPVVDADAGRLTGFEALLRWTHPDLGIISPAKFVPLAEEARLIAPIGEWVVRHACMEAGKWDDDMRIAVNVSPQQLNSPSFVAVVAQALSQSGIAADRLELEVTESVFMREGTGAIRTLDKLLDLGCRLSLDDFGTGYSSLGYLSRTRFSTIKIDRSFVRDAANGGREAIAIVRAVVALADSLGMATTAEGVETAEEHAMIRTLGCSKVQGFYFGRPLPVHEARILATRRARGDSVAA